MDLLLSFKDECSASGVKAWKYADAMRSRTCAPSLAWVSLKSAHSHVFINKAWSAVGRVSFSPCHHIPLSRQEELAEENTLLHTSLAGLMGGNCKQTAIHSVLGVHVKQIMYNGQSIEASWALGAAVHGLSSHKV
eukprot:scaffold40634_cov20-Tisochrysis_lutea.AAC.1